MLTRTMVGTGQRSADPPPREHESERHQAEEQGTLGPSASIPMTRTGIMMPSRPNNDPDGRVSFHTSTPTIDAVIPMRTVSPRRPPPSIGGSVQERREPTLHDPRLARSGERVRIRNAAHDASPINRPVARWVREAGCR